MSAPYESISAPPNTPPTISDECEQRAAHVAILEAWFTAHPWQEIDPASLKQLVGDNYQQRISDLRRQLFSAWKGPKHECPRIENVPKWETRSDGRKRKLSGSYVYKIQEPLGRDPSLPVTQAELFR